MRRLADPSNVEWMKISAFVAAISKDTLSSPGAFWRAPHTRVVSHDTCQRGGLKEVRLPVHALVRRLRNERAGISGRRS